MHFSLNGISDCNVVSSCVWSGVFQFLCSADVENAQCPVDHEPVDKVSSVLRAVVCRARHCPAPIGEAGAAYISSLVIFTARAMDIRGSVAGALCSPFLYCSRYFPGLTSTLSI